MDATRGKPPVSTTRDTAVLRPPPATRRRRYSLVTRSRWFMVLGPPLLMIAAGSAALAAPPIRPEAGLSGLQGLATCPDPGASGSGHQAAPEFGARPAGSWWRREPVIDPVGELTGWTLTMGSRDTARPTAELLLAPASLVSGPDNGRLVIATDDAGRSSVEIVDIARSCRQSIDVGRVVARHAIADPSGQGVLAHLLDRQTRGDLGIWHLSVDRPPLLILEALDSRSLAEVGIARVWSTDLRASTDGSELAVQSCDPERCLTRVLDLRADRVTIVRGEQGALIGLAGARLITMGSCPGLPCEVLSWDPETGAVRSVAKVAVGAALAADGRLVIAAPDGDGTVRALEVDGLGVGTHEFADLGRGRLLGRGPDAGAGIETAPRTVGLVGNDGQPTMLDLDIPATTPPHSTGEVQP